MPKNLRRVLVALLTAALVWASLPVRPAYAAGYVVNSLADNNTAGDGLCTLREASESANNAGNGDCGANSAADDTITFSVSGTITLGSALPNIVSGQGALTIDGGGNITISGNNSVRVFRVTAGAALTLQNLTVSNGVALSGGGIVNDSGGTLTISNSTFSANSAYYGGGIRNFGTLTVTNSTFSGNSATYDGGGIDNFGRLTVTNSTFSTNSAEYGGGIRNASGGTLTVSSSTFSRNLADYGAGIQNAGTLTVSSNTFSDNSATYNGGGIANDRTLTVNSSTFLNNQANLGGGIDNDSSSTLTVTNSTFSGNLADNGGGIRNFGTLTVTNSTFSGNSAAYNGGGINNEGTLTLNNTIIANSTGGGDCVNSGSGTVSSPAQNNLIEGTGANACGLTHGANGNIIGQDPGLGALTGSPAYFPLNFWSPAIDAGSNAICAAAPVSNQSQNGVTRPQDGNGDSTAICDIGSYELSIPIPPVVSSVTAAGVGAVLQGQTLAAGPSQFTVTFDQNVTTASAEDTNNYLLVRAGGNGVQTQSCAGGVSGSDTAIAINSAVYAPATYTTTLNVNGGQPLPAGLYRLFVCGTTSIQSTSGDRLYDGLTDYGLVFSVSSSSSGSGSGSSGTSGSAQQLPETGFPFGRVSSLPVQPFDKAYADTGLTLDIPSLNLRAPIVGVPQTVSGWDVTWLGTSVGWLEGSAFPTWQGNTVLTGHVWNADNTAGIFAPIKNLKYGDRIYIHAFGQTYVYEVRENRLLSGPSSVSKVFKHEEYDWVTLMTCEGYNPLTGNYFFRRMVRAVLVEVK